jgi:hypothetical protein
MLVVNVAASASSLSLFETPCGLSRVPHTAVRGLGAAVVEVLRSQRHDIGVAIRLFLGGVTAESAAVTSPTDKPVTQAFVIPFLEYLLSVAVSSCRRFASAVLGGDV